MPPPQDRLATNRRRFFSIVAGAFISGGVLATGIDIAYDHFVSRDDLSEAREIASAKETAFESITASATAWSLCQESGFPKQQLDLARDSIQDARRLYEVDHDYASALKAARTARLVHLADCQTWVEYDPGAGIPPF